MSAFHRNDSTTERKDKNAKKINMFQFNTVSTKTNVNILDKPTLNTLHVSSSTHIGPNINIAESFEKRNSGVEKISRPMNAQFQKSEKPPAHPIPKPGTNTRVYQPLKVAPVGKTATGGLFNSGPIRPQFRYKTPELSKVMPPDSSIVDSTMPDHIESAIEFAPASKLVSDLNGDVLLDSAHLYAEENAQTHAPPQTEAESMTKDETAATEDRMYEDEIDLSQIETDAINKKKIQTDMINKKKIEEQVEKEETVDNVLSVFQEKTKRQRKEDLVLSYEQSPLPDKPKAKKTRIEKASQNRFIIYLDKEDLSDIEIIIKRS